MAILPENIVKVFVADTHICAVNAIHLQQYQMHKHGWSANKWQEYYQIYLNELNNITIKPTTSNEQID